MSSSLDFLILLLKLLHFIKTCLWFLLPVGLNLIAHLVKTFIHQLKGNRWTVSIFGVVLLGRLAGINLHFAYVQWFLLLWKFICLDWLEGFCTLTRSFTFDVEILGDSMELTHSAASEIGLWVSISCSIIIGGHPLRSRTRHDWVAAISISWLFVHHVRSLKLIC